MKNIFTPFLFAFAFISFLSPSKSHASQSYINSFQLNEVLKGLYNEDSGVGTNSCTLCHNNASGGPGSINSSFGNDFVLSGGDSGLNNDELTTILSTMASLDSDGDGVTNGDEFEQCSNPNSAESIENNNSCIIPPTNDDEGGGCGFISTSGGGSPPLNGLPLLAFLALPLLLLKRLKRLTPAW